MSFSGLECLSRNDPDLLSLSRRETGGLANKNTFL